MTPTWRDALLSFSQLGPRLLSAHFQAKARQHLTVVTTYAPMDVGEDVAKDAFYLMLFACLKGAPSSDKLIVLGNFNAKLGSAWQEQGGIIGKFHLNRGVVEPLDNGAHLLDLVASFHLRAANTFFKHRRAHLTTWQHAATKRWYVKDYILVSGSTMRGVSDCRVFRNVHHGPSDHCLLGVSLQLHFRALKRDAPSRRGLWEGGTLRDSGRCVAFGQVLGSWFAVLSPQVSKSKEEWQRFKEGVSLAAAKTIRVEGPARRNMLGLSSDTLTLVQLTWLDFLAQP